jgi:hypothetical protein
MKTRSSPERHGKAALRDSRVFVDQSEAESSSTRHPGTFPQESPAMT